MGASHEDSPRSESTPSDTPTTIGGLDRQSFHRSVVDPFKGYPLTEDRRPCDDVTVIVVIPWGLSGLNHILREQADGSAGQLIWGPVVSCARRAAVPAGNATTGMPRHLPATGPGIRGPRPTVSAGMDGDGGAFPGSGRTGSAEAGSSERPRRVFPAVAAGPGVGVMTNWFGPGWRRRRRRY